MNIQKAYNFKEVNEQVTCSGTLNKVNLQSLADEGYKVVINLLPDDSEYAVAELSAFIASIWQLSEYPVWDKFVSDYLT